MPTAAIDFDGTLHPYTKGWLGTGNVDPEPPSPDLEYVLADLVGAGYTLVVHSARAVTKEGQDAIFAWLESHGLARFFTKIVSQKPAAVVYLDDRAIHFDGNWFAARDAILAALR